MYLEVIAGSRSEGTQDETEEEKIPVKGILLIWVLLWVTGAQHQWGPSEKQHRPCLSFEKTLRQGSRVVSTPDVLKSVGQEGVALHTMDSYHTWMTVGFLEEVTYEKSDS